MALERIPIDIRAAGGVSRMSDPKMIKEIQEAENRRRTAGAGNLCRPDPSGGKFDK